MITTLKEAIQHCNEVAEKKRKQVEGYSDKPYDFNSGVKKACLACAEEHELLAKWLTELNDIQQVVKDWQDGKIDGVMSMSQAFSMIVKIIEKAEDKV